MNWTMLGEQYSAHVVYVYQTLNRHNWASFAAVTYYWFIEGQQYSVRRKVDAAAFVEVA